MIKRLYFFIDHIGSALKFHGKAYHNRLANWPDALLIAGGKIVTTSRERKGVKAYEGLKRLELKGGEERDRVMLAREKADYLKENKGGGWAGRSQPRRTQRGAEVG